MRTPQEVKEQIEGLQNMKTVLPEYSLFGTPNHAKIDAQIDILDGTRELYEFEEGNWEEMDEENEIYRAAEEAEEWLDGTSDEDLYED